MHRSKNIKDKHQPSIRHQPNLKPLNFAYLAFYLNVVREKLGSSTGIVDLLKSPNTQISAFTILKL
jgi:hypothetical protein